MKYQSLYKNNLCCFILNERNDNFMNKKPYIIAFCFFILDLISKQVVIRMIDLHESIKVSKNFFYLTYTHNTGAAFSILTGQRIILILVATIILAILINYIRKNTVEKKIEKLAFSLVIGGAFGNLIDRIIRGYVIDFIDVKIFGYNFPIFNLADTFIVIGVLLMVITLCRKEVQNDNRK